MSQFFELFNRIYVINLASRHDRRREMAEQLDRVGLSFQAERVELFEAVRPSDAGSFPSIGARGCFMSHLGILENAARAKYQSILILEDDLNFNDDFGWRASDVVRLLASLPWSIFYGGYDIGRNEPLPAGCSEVGANKALGCTHFIGLKAPAIEEAARYLTAMLTRPDGDPDGGPMHVDGAYGWFRRAYPEFRTYAAMPELGYQRSSRTDIHTLRWYDTTFGARQAAAWVRRLRR